MRMTPEERRDLWGEDIDKLRFVADTPLTTWSAIHDEALCCALLDYPRSDLNPARSSSVKIVGCSQAAK
jgi:hypothetical protein